MAVVTLGCARNEVDSEELAGRLAAEGYDLVDDADGADAVLVNTCGFIETAKKDSVDAILAATDSGASVVAVGCMAERYGSELAGALPEATVLGFDDYGAIGDRLDDVLSGRPAGAAHPARPPHPAADQPGAAHAPRPRRSDAPAIPGHDWLRRKRLASGPTAALKLASGCDRRCAFCAIPTFRGAFVSRPPAEVLGEAQWLASQGVTELVLVSENSTSYGKDLGDLRSLEKLLPQLAAVEGIAPRPGGLPAAGRAAARPARGHRRHGRRRAVLRPVLPALLADPAAPDAPVRRHRRLPAASSSGPAAWRPAPASGPTSSSASRARPRTTSPSSSASSPRAAWTRSGSSATPTRRAPRRMRPVRQARPGRDRRPRPADHRPRRGAHRAARRGPDRRAGRGAAHRGPLRHRGAGRLARPRRPPGPRRRRHDDGGRACPTDAVRRAAPGRRRRGHRGRRPARPARW